MLEFPQIRRPLNENPLGARPSQAKRPGQGPPDTANLSTAWSTDDELAALEAVWESLCQDAAASQAALHLPPLRPLSRLPRFDHRQPRRGFDRADGPSGRLAS